jgi:hypothetical protein
MNLQGIQNTASLHAASNDSRLEHRARQLVGETFLSTLMKIGRQSPFKSEYGHGGRGEEVFQAELDRVLVESAAGRLDNKLSRAIAEHVARGQGAGA